MKILVTGDFHLTDNAKEEYRWNVFNLLKEYSCHDSLVILGDLTERKGKHSSYLVNRLVDSITSLRSTFDNVYILEGNHDFEKGDNKPFFDFLNCFGCIKFISIDCLKINSIHSVFVPYRNTHKFESFIDSNVSNVFMHTDVIGGMYESGNQLDKGINPTVFDKYDNVRFISGHIHTPQRIGKNFTYVGSPHQVDFSDNFSPRFLSIGNESIQNIPINDHISRYNLVINDLDDLRAICIKKGDHVKITYELHLSDINRWFNIKTEILNHFKRLGAIVFSVVPSVQKVKNVLIDEKSNKNKDVSDPIIVKRFGLKNKLSREQIEEGLNLVTINQSKGD